MFGGHVTIVIPDGREGKCLWSVLTPPPFTCRYWGISWRH